MWFCHLRESSDNYELWRILQFEVVLSPALAYPHTPHRVMKWGRQTS